jgi:hypothetical protein
MVRYCLEGRKIALGATAHNGLQCLRRRRRKRRRRRRIPIVSQINRFPTLPAYLFYVHFNIILPSVSA